MKPNQLIKSRREALGLSDSQVAEASGLSMHEYGDVERYVDEIRTVTHLSEIKRLCDTLGIGVLELFNLPCAFCEKGALVSEEYAAPRNELIRKRRIALGLSQDELGDQIGFETIAVQDMETREDFVEGWSFELIDKLSTILDVPPQVLLRVGCAKCAR